MHSAVYSCQACCYLYKTWVSRRTLKGLHTDGFYAVVDDDSLTAQVGTASRQNVNILSAPEVTSDAKSYPQMQAWREHDLPRPLSWRESADQPPEIALHQAKHDFAQWLSGTHAHPDYIDHIMRQEVANSNGGGKTYVGHQDNNGIRYIVDSSSGPGQLQHASLGT